MRLQPVFAYYPSRHFSTFNAPAIMELLVGGDNNCHLSNYAIFAANDGKIIAENKAVTIIDVLQENQTFVFFHYPPNDGRYGKTARLSYWIEGFYVKTSDFNLLRNKLEGIREKIRSEIKKNIKKHYGRQLEDEACYILSYSDIKDIQIQEIVVDEESYEETDLSQYAIYYSIEMIDSENYSEIQNPYKGSNESIKLLTIPEKNNKLAKDVHEIFECYDKDCTSSLSIQLRTNEKNKIGSNNEFEVDSSKGSCLDMIDKLTMKVDKIRNSVGDQNLVLLLEKYSHDYTVIINGINEKYDEVLLLNKKIKSMLNFFLVISLFILILLLVLLIK